MKYRWYLLVEPDRIKGDDKPVSNYLAQIKSMMDAGAGVDPARDAEKEKRLSELMNTFRTSVLVRHHEQHETANGLKHWGFFESSLPLPVPLFCASEIDGEPVWSEMVVVI